MAKILSLMIIITISSALWCFASKITNHFTQDTEVMNFGINFIKLLILFAFVSVWNEISACCLRGIGDTRTPMIIMLCSFVIFGQICLYFASNLWNSIDLIALAFPAGWIMCSLLMVIHFKRSRWEEKIKLS